MSRQAKANLSSTTSALHDLYRAEAADLAAFRDAFPCPVNATGLTVGIGGHSVALELCDAPATLAGQWPVAAHLVSAPAHRYPAAGALGRLRSRTLAALSSAVSSPSGGTGVDLRFRGIRVVGAGLIVEDRPVHLELFRVAD